MSKHGKSLQVHLLRFDQITSMATSSYDPQVYSDPMFTAPLDGTFSRHPFWFQHNSYGFLARAGVLASWIPPCIVKCRRLPSCATHFDCVPCFSSNYTLPCAPYCCLASVIPTATYLTRRRLHENEWRARYHATSAQHNSAIGKAERESMVKIYGAIRRDMRANGMEEKDGPPSSSLALHLRI